MKATIASILCLLTFACSQAFAAPSEINPKDASIFFHVDHAMGYTIGYFSDFSGTVELSDDKMKVLSAKIMVRTASVNTHSPIRDEGLRSAMFLDTEKFPQALYENGSLTIKGITKPLTWTVQEDKVTGKVILQGSFDRNDFGITYNKLLAQKKKSIGDLIELSIEIPAVK